MTHGFIFGMTKDTIGTTMRIRDLILPEDRVFFALFSEMAATIGEAATVLNEITHELPSGIGEGAPCPPD